MDSLNHPSSKPFNLTSIAPLFSSFTDYDLNPSKLSCAYHLAQAPSHDLPSIFNYPLSPSPTISSNQIYHEHSSPKEGWARILDEISRGVNPTQIIEDYDDRSMVIDANRNSGSIGDILDLLGMKDSNLCKETVEVSSESPLRSSLSVRASDWEKYGLNEFDDDIDGSCGPTYKGSYLKGSMDSIAQSKEPLKGLNMKGNWGGPILMESSINADDEIGPCKLESEVKAKLDIEDDRNELISKGSSIKAINWAGPTLRDIEAALAHTMSDTPPCVNHVNSSAPSVTLSCESSSSNPSQSGLSHVLGIKAPHQQEAIIHTYPPDFATRLLPLELPACSKDTLNKQIMIDAAWRYRLQKRNNAGPKHTMKVRSEEEALDDGYRWRKYGQKPIKNYPFPRSYYRCTSEKCIAKKQVERCKGEEEFFLVTYEGMHLHHKPNTLRKVRMKLKEYEEKKEQEPIVMCSSTHGSSSFYVDSTNIDPLFCSSLPTSPLSKSPTLDTPSNFDNFSFSKSPFSPTPTP